MDGINGLYLHCSDPEGGVHSGVEHKDGNMNDLKEIRWRQRFGNLRKAFALLQEAVRTPDLNRLEREGLIQRFEYTFELAWKTLKDYLEGKGVEAPYPRDVIKEAFRSGLVTDGDVWMEMLENRNVMSHTYDEKMFESVLSSVRERYFPVLDELMERFLHEA
jgi:nucleotidyltransferase substrate binding protein (TIGR01987 family)